MSLVLALLLTAQEPAPLPSPHKIGQALADVRYQQELMEARRYKPLRLFEPAVKPWDAVLRNINCAPAPLPEKWRDVKYDPMFRFGGSATHAAQCSYEYIWIAAKYKKSDEYKGPRQKYARVISAAEQRRLNKKKWQSETNLILLAEHGPCHLMGRTPPKEADCGPYWFFDGTKNFRD